ncbi:MAG TPA: hypothetical protein VFK89_10280 [Actinomycetota bacterium]|nr:hypothetical protein [Actinomycetota bacterium]
MKTSLGYRSAAILLAAGLLIADGAASVAAPRGKGTTFEGSCSFEGTVKFDPGATYVTQPLHYDYPGEGTCSGTLNGTEVKDVAVSVHQYGAAEGTCADAHTTEPGNGELRFPDGSVLTYTLEFTYQLPETDFSFRGSRSGQAHGTGTFQTDRNDPATPAKCATPTGATDVPMDMTLTTDGPLVGSKK